MPGPLQGFLNGFQTQLTANVLIGDTDISFPTAGMVPGVKYHIRIDDANPPTTFEYCEVQFKDTGTVSCVNGGQGRGFGGTSAQAHTSGPSSGFVTAVLVRESLLPAFARLDTENLMAFASASGISGQFFNVYGLPGSVSPSRYVGATSGAAPTTGSFLVGDFVLDAANGIIWVCTVAGSPGTWQNLLDGTNTGLTGAVSSLTRWVGATGGGPPTTGTWKQGDVITDRKGTLWICSVPGTPGTWVPPGITKIDEILVGTDPRYPAPASSITFGNPLPTFYRHLMIEWYARADNAGINNEMQMRFNNDATNTYDYQGIFTSTAAAALTDEVLASVKLRVGYFPAATATAGYFGQGEVRISHYAGANLKLFHSRVAWSESNATTNAGRHGTFGGKWRTLATPITRVDLLANGANFIVGSLFSLYGIP